MVFFYMIQVEYLSIYYIDYIHVFEIDHCSKAAEGACSKEVRAELHYQRGRIAHRKGVLRERHGEMG